MMAKRKLIKGYTLIELVLVLSMLSITSILLCSASKKAYLRTELVLEVAGILHDLEEAKLHAYFESKQQDIVLGITEYKINSFTICYKHIKANEMRVFHYNHNGNISTAFTITFYNGSFEEIVTFHIGGGNYEIKGIYSR